MSPTGSKNAPEARARERIDRLLEDAGWTIQDRDDMSVPVPAVAVRELRARLRAMRPIVPPDMWPDKVRAVVDIEKSLFDDREACLRLLQSERLPEPLSSPRRSPPICAPPSSKSKVF